MMAQKNATRTLTLMKRTRIATIWKWIAMKTRALLHRRVGPAVPRLSAQLQRCSDTEC